MIRYFLAFVLLGFAALPSSAQDAVFAAGDNKTITLVGGSDGAAGVEMVARSVESGVAYYSGEIPGDKSVVTFESSAFIDTGEEVAFSITLRFEGDTITAIADFPDSLSPSSDPSGTYNKLTEKQYLTFSKKGFEDAEDALKVRWSDLKKIIPAELLADLTERQKAWEEHREYMAASGGAEDAKATPGYWEAAWDMTQSRVQFLEILVGAGVEPGIAGVYLDEYGGAINIVPAGEGKFRFQINVVRGPTYHTGEITKTVAIAGGKGRFVDTDKEAFWEGEPCTIDFEFAGNRLFLKAENSAYYHGARAYFDGTYFKTVADPEIVEE